MDSTMQPTQPGYPQQMRFALALITLIASGMASTLEVLIRYQLGVRAISIRPFVGVIVLVVYAAMLEKAHDLTLLVWFLYTVVVVTVVRRIYTFVRWMLGRDDDIHSLSIGESWLSRVLPTWIPDTLILGIIEPALVFGLGYLVRLYDPPLGFYLMLASFCLGYTFLMARSYQWQRERDLKDAVLEQRAMAQQITRRF